MSVANSDDESIGDLMNIVMRSPAPPDAETEVSNTQDTQGGEPNNSASTNHPNLAAGRPDGDSDTDDGGDEPEDYDADAGQTSAPSMLSLIIQLINTRRLTDANGQVLKRFSNASESERSLMVFAVMLDILQRLQAFEKKWEPSSEAQTALRKFTYAALLSTETNSLKKHVKTTVQALVRQLGAGLPEDWETNPAKLATVNGYINTAATNHRSDIKKKFMASIKDKKNIATLTEEVCAPAQVKPTVQLWGRLALLRRLARKHGQDKNFYDLVETDLKNMQQKADTTFPADKQLAQDHVNSTFSLILEKDYERYGDPSATGQYAENKQAARAVASSSKRGGGAPQKKRKVGPSMS
ncbi:hypothetical protein OF83DRAFT_1283115 [Amylostereum chailletii]|nr:hypothetical protein OF83DRAFT_1283115 [Amylostereum chailletii]